MKNQNRNIMMLLKIEFLTEQKVEQEVEQLNEILLKTETPDNFCIVHELAQRISITRKRKKLLDVFRQSELKAFWFLINKN